MMRDRGGAYLACIDAVLQVVFHVLVLRRITENEVHVGGEGGGMETGVD